MKNKKKMEIFKIKMIIKYIINYDILVKKFYYILIFLLIIYENFNQSWSYN